MTQRERDLLDFIERHLAENAGVGPSYEQMAAALGLSSKSGVFRLITSLERQKRVARDVGKVRSIRVVAPAPLATVPDQDLVAEVVRRFGAAAIGLQAHVAARPAAVAA